MRLFKETRSQYQVYTQEALPTLFHKEPQGFLKFAEEKGLDFFRFWWNEAGKRTAKAQPEWVESILIMTEKDTRIQRRCCVLHLPPAPEEHGYVWMAFIAKAQQKKRWFPQPLTEILALQAADPGNEACLIAITPRGRAVKLKTPVTPALYAGSPQSIMDALKK